MSGKNELTKKFNKEQFRFRADAVCTAAIAASVAFLTQIGATPETVVSVMMLGAASIPATMHQYGNMLDAEAELNKYNRQQDPSAP